MFHYIITLVNSEVKMATNYVSVDTVFFFGVFFLLNFLRHFRYCTHLFETKNHETRMYSLEPLTRCVEPCTTVQGQAADVRAWRPPLVHKL